MIRKMTEQETDEQILNGHRCTSLSCFVCFYGDDKIKSCSIKELGVNDIYSFVYNKQIEKLKRLKEILK